MPEINEQQKKRYEEVREWLARRLAAQDSPDWWSFSNVRHNRYFRVADEILSDPRIVILDEDQEPVPENITSMTNNKSLEIAMISIVKRVQTNMLQSGFRRVLPK